MRRFIHLHIQKKMEAQKNRENGGSYMKALGHVQEMHGLNKLESIIRDRNLQHRRP